MPIYPKPSIPDWADPAQASVMDPLYKTLARKAVGALGLDDPVSSVMTAAMPMTAIEAGPSSLVKRLLSLDPEKNPKIAALSLMRRLAYGEPAANPADIAGSTVTRYVQPPLRYNSILTRMEKRIPEAAGKFTTSEGAVSRAPGLATQYQKEAAFRNPFVSQEDALTKDMATGRFDRNAIKSADDLNNMSDFRSSIPQAPTTRPTLLRDAGGSQQQASMMNALRRSNLTAADVKAIRKMSYPEAAAAYPNHSKDTLRGIIGNQTFAWLK